MADVDAMVQSNMSLGIQYVFHRYPDANSGAARRTGASVRRMVQHNDDGTCGTERASLTHIGLRAAHVAEIWHTLQDC